MGYFIWIALFIAICMFAVFIDEHMKKKHTKRPTVSAFYKKTPINDAIDKHNACLNTWHKLSEETNSSFIKKRREILFKQDKDASNALVQILNEFNKIDNNIANYIERSLECIQKRDVAGSIYCTGCINDLFNDIQSLTKAMERIEVTDVFNDAFGKVSVTKNVNKTESLFEGCNTKEEIEARYKHLAKAFHPDNAGGDKTMFERLQNEYKELKSKYE